MSSKILAGRYELIEKIGEGGMAVVYKAKCRLLNRYVAIKILKPEFVKDAKFIESFRRESQAAASLSHPNIVNVYDVGKEGNIYYIVMELVEGEVLSDIIKREGALPPQRALSITRQIALALSIAHKNHIIHRDVKPHNILITADGTAKITDFGIAKAVNSATIVNNTNTIMGSVHYFSPEQARGGYVDERSDIYSLGIVLYEMLTGKVPYDADNPVTVAVMHINNDIQPPTQINPSIPGSLEDIVMKATEKFQTNRFKSAEEMLEALNGADLRTNQKEATKPEFIIKEKEKDTMTVKSEKRPDKIKRKFKFNKIKIMAIILALIFAIPASQLVLAFINGTFSATEVKVPNLVGMTVSEAETELDKIDLNFVVDAELFNAEFPAGQIMSQDPPAEMSVKSGNTIKVNVSKGVKEGSVPNLTNKKLDDAVFTLENYGFVQGSVTIESSDLPKDFVIRQSPTPGTPATRGSSVNLVISDGLKLAMISMPNLVGMDIENAKLELTNAGLVLGEVTYDYSSIYALNVVTSQELAPGAEVARDTPIKLSVSKGEGNGAGTVNLTIPFNQAQNDVFYLSVYVDSTAVIDYQSRNKSAGSETVTLTGQGTANVFVLFDADKVIDKTVNFDTGEIY